MEKSITKTHLGYTGSCYGPSPAVCKAMESSLGMANSYPYEGYTELKKAIATYSKVKPENIMVTNGCDEAIALITYMFGRRVLIQAPTYSEFERIARGSGSEIRIKEQSIAKAPFKISFSRTDLKWASLAWICTPNNPTGDIIPRERILDIAGNAGGMVAVDEAYYEYCNKTVADSINDYKNLIVTRTFSKAFATEGVRLGYIISNPETIRALENSTQEYNVNRIARTAGLAVFRSMGYYKKEMFKLKSKLIENATDNSGHFLNVRSGLGKDGISEAMQTIAGADGPITRMNCLYVSIENLERIAEKGNTQKAEDILESMQLMAMWNSCDMHSFERLLAISGPRKSYGRQTNLDRYLKLMRA